MISKHDYYAVLGYITLLIHRRIQLDEWNIEATRFLEKLGANPGEGSYTARAEDYVGEAMYNSGNDPEIATKELLEAVGLEVADA